MATLIKRRKKYYARVHYTLNGKKKEKQVPLRTEYLEKAKAMLPSINEQEYLFKQGSISISDIKIKEGSNVEQVIGEYIGYLKSKGDCKATVRKNLFVLNFLKEKLNLTELKNIGIKNYPDIIDAVRLRWINLRTLNDNITTINSFFIWAVETGMLNKVPFRIKHFKEDEQKPKYFSNKELNMICSYLEDNKSYMLCDLIKLYVNTGMRLREITTSFCKDKYITIYKSKGKKERSIPVESDIEEIYKKYKDIKCWELKNISKDFTEALRAMGLYLTGSGHPRYFHCLRHTFAIRTYWKTKDIYRVSKLLGHSSVTMTERYADFDIKQLDKDFEVPEEKQ